MPYLMFCIGCVFFIFSVSVLNLMHTQILDYQIVRILSLHRIEWLDVIAKGLSDLGSMPFVLIFTTLWCVYWLRIRQYAIVTTIILAVSGSSIIGWTLKWYFDRPRPASIYHMVNSYGASFPSGHSVSAATLACLAMMIYRQHQHFRSIALIACLWFILMGISRIYLGVHYPTDVLAGWGIGFLWAALIWLGFIRIHMSKKQFNF
ncbi:phosphatase PAP2 family protein [Acinetobacter sp. ANC 4633]|uniref:phosphatase PAP2 family protein n=1 Tax=Acinetobacter sp. ANC 4633 TaxID=2529845 RepID=UPI001039D69D|nr:phosphatase PAP2 family protein [Acinetobacter sp. ANC 4633]TCB27999.1 phosphatase PAP2 family protein [Acinetobacter sp. ANC 4633]